MAYAVIVEKYVDNIAESAATINELNMPDQIGSVLFVSRLCQFSKRCVLGIGVNPVVSSPCERVALINRT